MLTSFILYGWAFYYFIKKFNRRQFKVTWVNILKGVGLIILGKLIAIFLLSLRNADIDVDKVDNLIGVPLFIFTIVKAAILLNKREKAKGPKQN